MKYDIEDFYGVATYQPADEYPNSWRQIPALKVSTKIYHRIWDLDHDYTVKEVGNMSLLGLTKRMIFLFIVMRLVVTMLRWVLL